MKKIRVIALLFLIGTSSWKCDIENPTSANGTEHEIQIRDNGFSPSTLTINLGEKVSWRNIGNLTHSVNPGTFMNPTSDFQQSPNLAPGDDPYPVTFTQTGIIPYYCDIHQQNLKEGTIIVQ